MVDAELIKSPMAFARLSGIPITVKIGTSPIALPTPPIEKMVEKTRVKKK